VNACRALGMHVLSYFFVLCYGAAGTRIKCLVSGTQCPEGWEPRINSRCVANDRIACAATLPGRAKRLSIGKDRVKTSSINKEEGTQTRSLVDRPGKAKGGSMHDLPKHRQQRGYEDSECRDRDSRCNLPPGGGGPDCSVPSTGRICRLRCGLCKATSIRSSGAKGSRDSLASSSSWAAHLNERTTLKALRRSGDLQANSAVEPSAGGALQADAFARRARLPRHRHLGMSNMSPEHPQPLKRVTENSQPTGLDGKFYEGSDERKRNVPEPTRQPRGLGGKFYEGSDERTRKAVEFGVEQEQGAEQDKKQEQVQSSGYRTEAMTTLKAHPPRPSKADSIYGRVSSGSISSGSFFWTRLSTLFLIVGCVVALLLALSLITADSCPNMNMKLEPGASDANAGSKAQRKPKSFALWWIRTSSAVLNLGRTFAVSIVMNLSKAVSAWPPACGDQAFGVKARLQMCASAACAGVRSWILSVRAWMPRQRKGDKQTLHFVPSGDSDAISGLPGGVKGRRRCNR